MNTVIKSHNLYPNSQQGRSMVEMLGVLAIIGVLSVGGISGFSKAMGTWKANQTIDQISTIIANVKGVAMRQNGSLKGMTVNAAIKMNLIPSDLVITSNSTKSLQNIYGGSIKIGTSAELYSNTSMTDYKDLVVEFDSIPREACIQIMSRDWGSSKIALVASGANKVNSDSYISGHAYSSAQSCSTGTNVAACYNQKMPINTIATACSCGNVNNCAIAIWSF